MIRCCGHSGRETRCPQSGGEVQVGWHTRRRYRKNQGERAGSKREDMGRGVRQGTRNHIERKGLIAGVEAHVSHSEEPLAEPEEGDFWVTASGVPLDPELVRKAREEELKEFKIYRLYIKVPVTECWEIRRGNDTLG